MNKKTYVCGFAFEAEYPTAKTQVILRFPEDGINGGAFNGCGGRVELPEGLRSGMARHFKEQTGIDTSGNDWNEFHCSRFRNGHEVHFMVLSKPVFATAHKSERGGIMALALDQLEVPGYLPDLEYLIPMARVFLLTPPLERPL